MYEALVKMPAALPDSGGEPLLWFNYGGNVSPEIVGRRLSARAELRGVRGGPARGRKCVGVHRRQHPGHRDVIAETSLDYIEAFARA